LETVTGHVQHYDWGDPSAIPTMLGVPPDGRPWAELWLGTHPAGPATVDGGRPLQDVSGELPYLLKVLAAAQPLSLQTHPARARAEAGFEREEAAGIPRTDPARIYKDRNPKPELLCALTPFDTLCGFRPVDGSVALLRTLGSGADPLAASLEDRGLEATVTDLYRGALDPAPVVAACAGRSEPEPALVSRLAAQHPGEPSVVVTLLLNRVLLEPGDAVFLDAGNLHAYLGGVGVEVMGASDNVVRGGLTTKHVDVDELLAVLDWTPLPDPVVRATADGAYETPGTPFLLRRADGGGDRTATGRELLLWPAPPALAVYLAPGERTGWDEGPVFRVEERAWRS
jgi:mannose-6-phosphate isomerase